jgi:hypothetical protein
MDVQQCGDSRNPCLEDRRVLVLVQAVAMEHRELQRKRITESLARSLYRFDPILTFFPTLSAMEALQKVSERLTFL